jgi:hypothetical protein
LYFTPLKMAARLVETCSISFFVQINYNLLLCICWYHYSLYSSSARSVDHIKLADVTFYKHKLIFQGAGIAQSV